MRKLLDWEKTVQAQRQKQFWLWSLALACWVAALWATYWIEHTLYGGVIDTGTFTYLGISIGLAIGCCLRAGKVQKPVSEKEKRTVMMIVTVFVLILVAGMFYFRMYVKGMQFICVMIVAYWSDHKEQQDLDKISLGACALFFAAMMLVVGTFAGPKIMGLTSTKQAERILAAEGFSDVEYVHWLYGRWLYQDAMDKSFYEKGMKDEQFYLFEGKKDGENWRLVIDPKGGEIIIVATETDEPTLADWI